MLITKTLEPTHRTSDDNLLNTTMYWLFDADDLDEDDGDGDRKSVGLWGRWWGTGGVGNLLNRLIPGTEHYCTQYVFILQQTLMTAHLIGYTGRISMTEPSLNWFQHFDRGRYMYYILYTLEHTRSTSVHFVHVDSPLSAGLYNIMKCILQWNAVYFAVYSPLHGFASNCPSSIHSSLGVGGKLLPGGGVKNHPSDHTADHHEAKNWDFQTESHD